LGPRAWISPSAAMRSATPGTARPALPGVVESAVIGLPHPDFGEAVAAVVVGARETRPQADDIIGSLRGQIANFKVPKRVWVVDELPRNAMGKVQKNLLRDRYSAAFTAA